MVVNFFFFTTHKQTHFGSCSVLGSRFGKGEEGGTATGREGGREGGWDLFRSALELKGNL